MFFIMKDDYKIISKHENKDEILRQWKNLNDTKNNHESTKYINYILIEGLEIEYSNYG